MHIKLINKKIHFNNYKVKCAVGKRGISSKKVEGDNKTPRGTFKIQAIYYRKDRMKELKSLIKKKNIRKNMGWCDDSKSKKYNKLIKFPFSWGAEKLYLNSRIYDILIILNFNNKPVKKKKGSAIFIHVAKKKYTPTKGCVAVSKTDIRKIVASIKKNSKITIY